MKKLMSLVLALALILGTAAAMADPIEINGSEKRNIKINEAGLNPSADEMIEQNISPTTGRQLDAIEVPAPPLPFSINRSWFRFPTRAAA